MEDGNSMLVNLTEDEALRLRQYLLRGGFLLADDTHGDYEWDVARPGFGNDFPRAAD